MSFGLFDVGGAWWLASDAAGDNYTVRSHELNSMGRGSQADVSGNCVS
jgi:hypothetical protein